MYVVQNLGFQVLSNVVVAVKCAKSRLLRKACSSLDLVCNVSFSALCICSIISVFYVNNLTWSFCHSTSIELKKIAIHLVLVLLIKEIC